MAKNGVAVQPVQLFVLGDGGLSALRTDTSTQDDSSGVGRVGLWGLPLGLVGSVANQNSAKLLRFDTLAGFTPQQTFGLVTANTPHGFNLAGDYSVNAMLDASLADGLDPAALNALMSIGLGVGYNGATLDRLRTASAANFDPAAVPAGVQIVAGPGDWSINHVPAVNVRATITRAAVAGQRHVCTSISVGLCAVGAVAVPLVAQLRDGATGAGTVLWSQRIIAPAGTAVLIEKEGLNIVGSVNTAMTLEFSAAPAATDFETVALAGHTVP